ncbi:hypothetical protein B0H13DRAFT_2300055 [Mycena leptocephala]|nr:hypothetical protein B0H13DRAFT_2300055 [Mycena leptocephala]
MLQQFCPDCPKKANLTLPKQWQTRCPPELTCDSFGPTFKANGPATKVTDKWAAYKVFRADFPDWRGNITDDDVVVTGSTDGAQLYRNKASDCWIGIWIIGDFDPVKRYRKVKILPRFFIGGWGKPKDFDSFFFPPSTICRLCSGKVSAFGIVVPIESSPRAHFYSLKPPTDLG